MPDESAKKYVNLARKYRPQVFNQVIGQDAVSQTIINSLSSGRIAHAYLFYGPRGCGKTTTARILAKALNCTGNGADKPVSSPCGVCPQCADITNGSDLDVLEIDAASNTQVEKVREVIIDTVALAPNRDRFKVFILDEVHMLSTSSFNALLKTIEEPPAHVVFILATTEFNKVPATILSRCQTYRFRPIPNAQIVKLLEEICQKENVKADAKALELIAENAKGGLRDAETLLDRAISYSSSEINSDLVAQMLGFTPENLVKQAVEAVINSDFDSLHKAFEKISEEGFDALSYVRDIKKAFSDLFYLKMGYAKEPFKGAAKTIEKVSPAGLASYVRRMSKVYDETRFSDMPLITAETGLFTISETSPDIETFINRLAALEEKLDVKKNSKLGEIPSKNYVYNANGNQNEPPNAVAVNKEEAAAGKSEDAPVIKKEESSPKQTKSKKTKKEPQPQTEPAGEIFSKAMQKLAIERPLVYSMLEGAEASFDGQTWRLTFLNDNQYAGAKPNEQAIAQAFMPILGDDVQIEIVMNNADTANVLAAEHVEEENDFSSEGEEVEAPQDWGDLNDQLPPEEEPSVKKVKKYFECKVVRVVNPNEKL